jgi:hypothetical protein
MSDDGHRRADLAEGAISAAMAVQGMVAPIAGGLPATDAAFQQTEPAAIVQEVSPADTDVAPWFTAPGSVEDLEGQLVDHQAEQDRELMERGLEGPAKSDYANESPPAPEAADYWNDVAQDAFADGDAWSDVAPAADAGLWADGGAPADGGFDAGPGGLF